MLLFFFLDSEKDRCVGTSRCWFWYSCFHPILIEAQLDSFSRIWCLVQFVAKVKQTCHTVNLGMLASPTVSVAPPYLPPLVSWTMMNIEPAATNPMIVLVDAKQLLKNDCLSGFFFL